MTSYVFNKDGTNPAPPKSDIDDMTNLTIKIGFGLIAVLLMTGLFIFVVIALS